MANTNIYLKLTDVKGESVDAEHKDHIEVHGWSFGVDNQADFSIGTGGQGTQSHVHSLMITKHIDISTATLFGKCTQGDHIDEGTLSLMKLAGKDRVEYMKLVMTNVMVKSSTSGGHGSDSGVGLETIQLVFAKFKMTYTQQDDKGKKGAPVDFGWDIQQSVVA